MRTIWKFTLEMMRQPQPITLPAGAFVLTAREQGGAICMWVEVDTSAANTVRRFEVFGTGWEMPPGTRGYIGTVQFTDGSPLVFHVYERLDPC